MNILWESYYLGIYLRVWDLGQKVPFFFNGLWYILPNCLRKLGLIFHFLQQLRGSVHFLTLTIPGIVLTSQKNTLQLFENVCMCVEQFPSSFSLVVLAFFLFICSIIVLFPPFNPAFYLREVVWRLQEESFGLGGQCVRESFVSEVMVGRQSKETNIWALLCVSFLTCERG